MNKQDMRAIRLQAAIIRGQIECLTSAKRTDTAIQGYESAYNLFRI